MTKKGLPILERMKLWTRYEGDCWIWTGQITNAGYGRVGIDGKAVSSRLYR
jgi:hypothetical protein